MKVLSIEQINPGGAICSRLLTGGSRTAVARQRTLEATVDWSYDLLSDAERRILRRSRCSPGDGRLTLPKTVVGEGRATGTMSWILSRLVDKSLVNVDNTAKGADDIGSSRPCVRTDEGAPTPIGRSRMVARSPSRLLRKSSFAAPSPN